MSIPALRSIWAKPHLIHVALLDILKGMLVDTVGLMALPILGEKPANWHTASVQLVQKTTGISFHAQSPQPMPADSLPIVPSACLHGP